MRGCSKRTARFTWRRPALAHGEFRDKIYSDARLYLKMEQWEFGDNRGLENPAVPDATRCPDDCGLCSLHTSHTVLSNVDLTNRCNLTCPVCFANANVAGYLYEPSFEQVTGMLEGLRAQRPVPNRVVQFSGGEPTLYPRFMDVLRKATELGFTHIQAATNGISFADLEFAQAAKEAGLHTLYLQFDGLNDDIYLRTRGQRLMETKLAAIENCRKAGLKIVFVPTIVKGVNDHQLGDMVRFAIDNIDCVSGFSFQPVAFTGRINRRDLEAKRFTQSDLAHCISDQTGMTDKYNDWFPLSCTSPFSKLLSALQNLPAAQPDFAPALRHGDLPLRGSGVEEGRAHHPLLRCRRHAARYRPAGAQGARARGSSSSPRSAPGIPCAGTSSREFAPPGLTFERFLNTLQGMTDHSHGRGQGDGTFTYKTLLVAGMHFMDAYNYDINRVKRCVIHYTAPNGLVYPFCTYNSGPCFREKIEKQFSVPFDLKAAKATPSNGNGLVKVT